jgi:hypothetical protein
VADAAADAQEAAEVVALRQSTASLVELVEERLTLMEEEGMSALAWDTLWVGSEACQLGGDAAAAKQWSARAAECARLALGSESDLVERYTV